MKKAVLAILTASLISCAQQADQVESAPSPTLPKEDSLPVSIFTSHEVKTTSGYRIEAAVARQPLFVRSVGGYVIEATVQ